MAMGNMIIQLVHHIDHERRIYMKKKVTIFLSALLLLQTYIVSINVIASEKNIDNLANETIMKYVSVENGSIIFDYSVDDVWIFTNDGFREAFEGEKFCFVPENNGKYVIATGKFNEDVENVLLQPDLLGVTLTMQSYIVEKSNDNIIIKHEKDFFFPPYNDADSIQQSLLVKEQLYNVVNREISQDYYFRFVKVRTDTSERSFSDFYINSSSTGAVVETLCNSAMDHRYTIKLRPETETSLADFKRYSIRHLLGNDITYNETVTNSIQIAKREKDELTLYNIDETNSEFVLSSLSIEHYKQGDVNGDGEFNISDVVLLQKWLISVQNVEISVWQSADFYEDEKIDIFDLILMKQKLIYRT